MKLPDDILTRTPEEAARRIALGFLAEARRAERRLADPDDAEALHDFRVAIRRLRSTLRGYRSELGGAVKKKARRELKAIGQATSGGRDAEVALAWLVPQRSTLRARERLGFDWLVERLTRRKDESYARVRDEVHGRFVAVYRELRPRLAAMTVSVDLLRRDSRPTWADFLARASLEHVEEVALLLGGVKGPEDAALAHEARIALKRFRYLLEPVRKLVPLAREVVEECKGLQELLGELNDAAVFGDELAGAEPIATEERTKRLHALALAEDDERMRAEATRNEKAGFAELDRRSRERFALLFAELERAWLGAGVERFVARARALADELARLGRGSIEVERKYLLARVPEICAQAYVDEIDQGYVPGRALNERVRAVRGPSSTKYERTVKSGAGLARFELQETTTKDVFDVLWTLTEGARVQKRRYRIPEGELTWEIDEFTDRDLVLAEVELPSADVVPELPAWLAPHVVREVTGEPAYLNLNLAK